MHTNQRRPGIRRSSAPVVATLALALGIAPLAARAQQDAPAAPAGETVPPAAPVQSEPLAPLPGTQAQNATPAPAAPAQPAAPAPAPAAPDQQPAAPSAEAPSAPAPATPPATAPAQAGEITTLAPPPTDTSVPDEVEVTARPAAGLRASSSWDEGYDTLTRTFQRLADEMRKAGIRVTGKPLSTFIETDDNGFRFEAQLPIEAAPAERPAGLSPDIVFDQTPSGKFIRFVHKSPYDDIDSTYEAVSAYLDSKGIEVKDSFTEEYVNQGTNAGDPSLELFIYVQPKG